mgnify:CR=1 FL=1
MVIFSLEKVVFREVILTIKSRAKIKLSAASACIACLRQHTERVHQRSVMLRVLNTLNGRCEARPERWVSSPVERLVSVRLHRSRETEHGNETKSRWIFIQIYSLFCFLVWIGPPKQKRNDACECTLYLTQLGGFVSRQRFFLRKSPK